MLELKDLTPDAKSEAEIKKGAEAVDVGSMFQKSIFGSNATVNVFVGHHNSQHSQIQVTPGNFQSLSGVLAACGVPDDEIEKLKRATESDEREGGEPSLSGETGRWLMRLLERAGKGALKIGSDVVKGAVTSAISAYLGLK